MSRRRKMPPPPPGTVRVPLVAIVCTDGGQHPEAMLHRLLVTRSDDRETVAWRGKAPITDWRPADGSHTFAFTCRRCRRDVRVREANLLAAMHARRDARPDGRFVIDTSLLP